MYGKTNVQSIQHKYLELSQPYLEKEKENSATLLFALYLSRKNLHLFYFIFVS